MNRKNHYGHATRQPLKQRSSQRILMQLAIPLLLTGFFSSSPTIAIADTLTSINQPMPAQTLATETASPSILQFTASRIDGTDRIATAIATSKKGWAKANVVFLNEYNDFPDAIAATPLAVKLDAPILLTNGDALDTRVESEINRLKPEKIILLGGNGQLRSGVESRLTELKIPWQHLGGLDRYETSALIAAQIPSDSLIVANGDNFPDALSAASYAGIKQIPILLTSDNGIPTTVSSFYHTHSFEQVVVVGGEGVIPSSSLAERGIPVTVRLGGSDRYQTGALTYNYAKAAYTSPDVYLASGEDFPDALVGSVLAAKQKAPLLISQNRDISKDVLPILQSLSGKNSAAYLFGGKGVLRNRILSRLAGADLARYPLSGFTIVVDPGHGSPDPGAVGPSGTQEKDNTLAIAQDLGENLTQAGADVILTRTGDASPAATWVGSSDLKARVDIANKNLADLFISVHNDSAGNAQGTTTYYSEDNPQAGESLRLAQAIQTSVVQTLGTYDHGVGEALFYVIHHTIMPAVLVEVAYISNPTEERLLADPVFRQKAADGIYKGILAYYTAS